MSPAQSSLKRSQAPQASRPEFWHGRGPGFWIPIALVVATFLAFAPLFEAEFTQRDDLETVAKNPAMLGRPVEIIHFWTNLRKPTGEIYIPLTQTVWYLLAQIARLDRPGPDGIGLIPGVFHLANIALHAIGGILAYLILRRFTRGSLAAGAGALVFILHPLQVESVGWISGMKDVLSGALSLAALYAFVRYVQGVLESIGWSGAPPTSNLRWRLIWYFAGLLAAALAMLAKPAAVVLPILAAVLGVAMVATSPRDGAEAAASCPIAAKWKEIFKAVFLPLLPWILLTLPIIAEGRVVQPAPLVADVAVRLRPAVAADALAFYLGKVFVPLNLGIDYGRTPAAIVRNHQIYWTWIIPLGLLAAGIKFRKKSPLLVYAILLFFVAPLPVLGFVKFDFQLYSTVSDHYMYVALLGPALAGALLIDRFSSWQATWIVCAALLTTLGALTFMQARTWQSDFAVFDHAVDANPGSLAGHSHLAKIHIDQSDWKGAIREYELALHYFPDQPAMHHDLAYILYGTGDLKSAVEHYRAALAGQPDDAGLRNDLGIALAQQHRYAEARTAFEDAIAVAKRVNPTYVDPRINLGRMLTEQGDRAAAAEQYRLALQANPGSSVARQSLDALQSGIGNP